MNTSKKHISEGAQMRRKIHCATRPAAGQSDGSDRCGWWATPARIVMAVADGMGHGPDAAFAAEAALACIGAGLERPFDEFFTACDARLRDTHGVALVLAVVDVGRGSLTITSIGNIHAALMTTNMDCYRLGTTKGMVGGDHDRLTLETRTLSSGDVLALFSDGVDEFFALRETLERAALSSTGNPAWSALDRLVQVNNDAAILIYRHDA